MKQYDHEVLSFTLNTKKGNAEMEKSLREWGAAGFEIVSVIPSDMHSTGVTVFLKRELTGDPSENGAAAQ